MLITANNYGVNFGLKNNANASKKVLKNVDPELKKDIVNGLNSFCDITQRRGIKGEVVLKSIDGDTLSYIVKPTKTNKTKKLSIDLSTTIYKDGGKEVPRRETIKRSLLESLNYLFS